MTGRPIRGRRLNPFREELAMRTSRLSRLVFAGVTAAALGFGAKQAFAAPSAAQGEGVRACTDRYCKKACAPFYGYCDYSLGICACAG